MLGQFISTLFITDYISYECFTHYPKMLLLQRLIRQLVKAKITIKVSL